MSDFYDSLEDESYERYSSDSSETTKSEGDEDNFEVEEEKAKNKWRENVAIIRKCRIRRQGVCPFDLNRMPTGVKTHSHNIIIDNEVLNKQGLQFNGDGSFSKSPRSDSSQDTEPLPFVTREYRNLQFQKKKTYELRHRGSSVVRNRKPSVTANLKSGKSDNKMAAEEKKMGKSLSYMNGSSPKDAASINLTDSMKEVLLKKHSENSPRRLSRSEQFKRIKPIINFFESSNPPGKQKPIGASGNRQRTCENDSIKLPALRSGVKTCGNGVQRKDKLPLLPAVEYLDLTRGKSAHSNIFRNGSEISLRCVKPSLSYYERYQKENGFNPMSLKIGFDKRVTDTSRSNVGDSVRSELPEISTRAVGLEETTVGEDEELFYKLLIERDRMGLSRIKHSTRSDSRIELTKTMAAPSPNPCKKEDPRSSKKNSTGSRQNAQMTDIPGVHVCANPLKKNCHYCPLQPAANLTKAELALKARAYGFMVNARNIFRLKNQSADKLGPPKPQLRCTEGNCPLKGRRDAADSKGSRTLELPSVERNSRAQERVKHQLGKAETKWKGSQVPETVQKGNEESEFTAEILQQMRYCLTQDITYENYEDIK